MCRFACPCLQSVYDAWQKPSWKNYFQIDVKIKDHFTSILFFLFSFKYADMFSDTAVPVHLLGKLYKSDESLPHGKLCAKVEHSVYIFIAS